MKRDMKAVLKILEEVEELEKEYACVSILLPKASENRDQARGYAAKLLHEAGYVLTCRTDRDDELRIKSLTWAGHDLLDRLRREGKGFLRPA